MNSPEKKKPEEAPPVEEKLSDEELKQVTGGTQGGSGEQQINIADMPNVRVDVTPM